MADYEGGSPKADHLCVLVHGLWGSPDHMANVARSLRAQHPADQLHILCAKRNRGFFTYDGIDLGGERVCLEIEEELAAIEASGGKIRKLSVVGYSLGGLVARYAIGLLHAKGILDGLECMNFTAFASPFLGVRSPLRGSLSWMWNGVAPRLLSTSGRQLFGIDSFRDTGRPLLAVLADPNSIFMSGLRRFRRHTLYANVVNDRSSVFYTSAFSKTDPYVDLSKVQCRFVDGYDDVVLDPLDPVSPLASAPPGSIRAATVRWLRHTPLIVALAIFFPVISTLLLANSCIQVARSAQRIRLHEKGLAGIDAAAYRVPLWMREIRGAVEGAYESVNSAQDQEYLSPSSSSSSSSDEEEDGEDASGDEGEGEGEEQERRKMLAAKRTRSSSRQPTLALAPDQFAMIRGLDSLRWRKYPVWIHKVRHTHAAIILRVSREAFSEGKVVLQHWLREEFLI